jgi:putative transposase
VYILIMSRKMVSIKVAESSVGGCQPFQRQADCSVTACGEEGSGRRRKTAVKPASMKQEVSFVPV